MYKNYFGLQQAPFKITPDTKLFFPGANRGAVLQALIYAITNGEGITKVVGEVGSGKTMLCRMLENSLPNDVKVVYLANPSLTPENILHAIGFEMGLDVEPDDPHLKVMHKIQNYLVGQHARGRRVVMFVEEAQSMPIPTLEEMRLLSNLETEQDKLLQIVLFGQPELDENLSQQQIRQLKERITYSFKLAPLQEYEIRDYINTRMRTSGYQGMDLFNQKAIKLVWKHSKGLLRRINIIADKACLAAFADNARIITPKHVRVAIDDSDFAEMPSTQNKNSSLIPSLILLVLIGTAAAGWWYKEGYRFTLENEKPLSKNETIVQPQHTDSFRNDMSPPAQQNKEITTWQNLDQDISTPQ